MTPVLVGEHAVEPLPGDLVRRRLANLRRHTAPHHVAAERCIDLDSRLDSPDSYADLLARLYGFYAPFEAELDHAVTRWSLPIDVEARRKVPLLARDLTALGMTPSAVDGLARCHAIAQPESPAAALGCLYVVEGATLGGQLIARRVAHRLGFDHLNGASFFHGYGADTGPRWRTFCAVLAAASSDEVAERAIVGAAIDTFVAFDRWLAATSPVGLSAGR